MVGQGLTLPYLIRRLGVVEDGTEEENEELRARLVIARAALERVDQLESEDWTRDGTVERVRRLYEFRQRRFKIQAGKIEDEDGHEEGSLLYQRMMHEIYAAQRDALVQLRNSREISSEVMRRVERELDLEETRLEVRGNRGAERVRAHRLRGALLVEHVELHDLEARAFQVVDHRAREVAAAEHAASAPARGGAASAHALVGGQPVLHEVQGAAGLEDAPDLGSARASPGSCTSSTWTARRRSCRPSNGSDWPSRPERSTGTLAALRRFAASFQPRSAGSTAATRVTRAG